MTSPLSNPDVSVKTCCRCGKSLPVTEFHRNRSRRDGLVSSCKKCTNEYYAAMRRRQGMPPRAVNHSFEDGVEGKRCSRCGGWSPLGNFAKCRKAYDGLRSECKACTTLWNKAYWQSHREEISATTQRWRRAHPDKCYEYSRQWRLANPEKSRACTQKWRRANPRKNRAKVARRRAMKLGAAGAEYTTSEKVSARWAMFGGRCWVCGDEAQETDHVKPLASGGANWPCNLRPICRFCNASKGATWPYTPRASKGL